MFQTSKTFQVRLNQVPVNHLGHQNPQRVCGAVRVILRPTHRDGCLLALFPGRWCRSRALVGEERCSIKTSTLHGTHDCSARAHSKTQLYFLVGVVSGAVSTTAAAIVNDCVCVCLFSSAWAENSTDAGRSVVRKEMCEWIEHWLSRC